MDIGVVAAGHVGLVSSACLAAVGHRQDRRIGLDFLRAGIGWGGSCFPKDILALEGIARGCGIRTRLLRAANEANAEQRGWVLRQLRRHHGVLSGVWVGLLGLAFKPNTDDLRNAPSLEIAAALAREGVVVRAFDPVVQALPAGVADMVELVRDAFDAASGAHALVLVTEWPCFAGLDLGALRSSMRGSLLLDGRNLFDPGATQRAGFTYVGVGRGPLRECEPRAG